MSFESIRHRMHAGRPLVVDSDTGAAFGARGLTLASPGALGVLLRERPDDVLDHYRAEVASRVDILSALTADTTPRVLAEVGMQHRSAQLTGRAVDLAFVAAHESEKTVGVAGVLGSEAVGPVAADRLHEELTEHAQRLAAAGCELLIARGQGSRLGLMTAVVAAAGTELPTWAVVECLPNGELLTGGAVQPLLEALEQAGASAVLFEVSSVDHGVAHLERARSVLEGTRAVAGVLLAAGPDSVRGFVEENANVEQWAGRALELDAAGARIIGGGAGTTEAHTASLARALGSLHPSLPLKRSDTEIDVR
jgi:5-methyltetrahydrofolate--homocysteine methyltransferase